MKSKAEKNSAQLVLVIVFCAALGLITALFFLLPKHAGELSPLEFRTLADHPIAGKDASTLMGELVKGDLSSNVDSFLEDHFPGRSAFIAANSYFQRLTGRNANQPVVWGREGRLFDAPLALNTAQVDKNIGLIDGFAADNGLEAEIVVVPSSASVVKDELPAVTLDYHDPELYEYLSAHSASKVVDWAEYYSARSDRSGLFYRTDHHWTMDGAYACYESLCGRLGIEPVSKDAFSVREFEFYGSFYREAGLWGIAPDTLEVWDNETLSGLTVTIGAGARLVSFTGPYDESKLEEGEVDKYAAYLYSNNDLTVIENPAGNGETILLVKDSYGNSIAPLLAMNYSRVIMIDTRYYRQLDLPKPSELVEQYGITKLLVVFGTESMLTDTDLVYLR